MEYVKAKILNLILIHINMSNYQRPRYRRVYNEPGVMDYQGNLLTPRGYIKTIPERRFEKTESEKKSEHKASMIRSCPRGKKLVHVKPYVKSNGTRVAGYNQCRR